MMKRGGEGGIYQIAVPLSPLYYIWIGIGTGIGIRVCVMLACFRMRSSNAWRRSEPARGSQDNEACQGTLRLALC